MTAVLVGAERARLPGNRAQCDVVRDEGVAYARRLQDAGVDVTLDEVPGTLHGFISMLGLRQAREALRRAASWLRSRF